MKKTCRRHPDLPDLPLTIIRKTAAAARVKRGPEEPSLQVNGHSGQNAGEAVDKWRVAVSA